jgi:hypothetical protein
VHFPPRHTPALGRFMDVVREVARP